MPEAAKGFAVRPISSSDHMTGVRRHGLPDVAIPWNAIRVRLACTLTPSGGGLGGNFTGSFEWLSVAGLSCYNR